jgi:hypothetical protein
LQGYNGKREGLRAMHKRHNQPEDLDLQQEDQRTAAAGAGGGGRRGRGTGTTGGGGGGYRAGQNVICRVGYAEPGGYAVIISKDNLPGFLPTRAQLKTGEEILAQYVCVYNNRILLSARLDGRIGAKPQQSVRWEDYLSDITREEKKDSGSAPE